MGHAIPGDRPDSTGSLALTDERWTGRKDRDHHNDGHPDRYAQGRRPEMARIGWGVAAIRSLRPRALTVNGCRAWWEFGTRWTQFRKELRLAKPAEDLAETLTLSAERVPHRQERATQELACRRHAGITVARWPGLGAGVPSVPLGREAAWIGTRNRIRDKTASLRDGEP